MATPTMEAVVPLIWDDYPRFRILAHSLTARFLDPLRLWIVAPGPHKERIEARIEAEGLLGSRHHFEVLDEAVLLPELRRFGHLKGWYRQQLVKLAIAERIETAFYLTFDADVICVRPVRASDLVQHQRAPCCILDEDSHPDWYEGSSRVLGLPTKRGVLHNVTPAVLARDAVVELTRFLEAKAKSSDWSPGWRGIAQRVFLAWAAQDARVWPTYLAASAPWTEYALYYSFLEATGRFDAFHRLSDRCIYAVAESVWSSGPLRFDQWPPEGLFEGTGAPYFALVQSNTRTPPDEVWAKVRSRLEGD